MLYVAVPAAVVEHTGMSQSLGRSRLLTLDNRLKIFGLVFLIGIISVAINGSLQVAFLVGGKSSSFTVYTASSLLVNIVMGIWQSSAACIAYYTSAA
jgi:hypothetical protein